MAAVTKSNKKLISELHQAVKLNHIEKVEKLLSQTTKKTNLNVLLDDMSETVLTEAIKGGDMRIIELIIEHGADTTAHNFSGKGPMHMAAFIGNNRSIASLLQHNTAVDTTDKTGRSALHWATRKNQHIVELLLKKGADINKPAADGNTPILDAAQHSDVPMISYLLDNGSNIMATNGNGETTGFLAAKGGNLRGLQLLIKHGADVYAETNNNETLLHIAAAQGNLSIIQYLVENHKCDKTFMNKVTSGGICKAQGKPLPCGGWTALHYACAGGHVAVVEYLLKQGVSWRVKSDEDITPKDLVKIYKHTTTLLPIFPDQSKKEKGNWKDF